MSCKGTLLLGLIASAVLLSAASPATSPKLSKPSTASGTQVVINQQSHDNSKGHRDLATGMSYRDHHRKLLGVMTAQKTEVADTFKHPHKKSSSWGGYGGYGSYGHYGYNNRYNQYNRGWGYNNWGGYGGRNRGYGGYNRGWGHH